MEKKIKYNRIWAIVIGFGLALSPIHNQWLTDMVTSKGEVGFFIPAFGTAVWLMGSLFFVYDNWRDLDWGDKKIYIPLFIIVGSMGLSGLFTGDSLGNKFAPLLMGLSLFAIYLVARKIGKEIFFALVPFVCITALSVIVCGIINPGEITGGVVSNYCASAGFMIFGTIVNKFKWQWILATIALVGLFFVGALEGAFIVVVLGIVLLAHKDFSRKLLFPIGAIVILVTGWLLLGYLTPLYYKINVYFMQNIIVGQTELNDTTIDKVLTDRWYVIKQAVTDIKPLGHGYRLSVGYGNTVHNIPLVIVDQIGPVAGLAWLFVTIYCLVKTKWRYAWVAVIAMSVFDHYLWTQFTPYWWALVGVSLTSDMESDLIFLG